MGLDKRLGFRVCTLIGTILCLPGLAAAQGARLADAWFFPDRPAPLKSVEGKAVPEVRVKSWIGEPVSLADSRGKVVVIDFWATWCGPCMAAIPKNVELVKKYKDQGLVFFGIHDANAGWDKAAGVVTDKGINYPVALDDAGGPSAKAFNLAFWPTYVIVDRSGVVRGAGLAPDHLEDAVKMLLAEAGPAGAGAPAAAAKGLPADWYYGADGRPAQLKALEGKPMPALSMTKWLNSAPAADAFKDRVLVLHFLAVGNYVSMKQAETLAALEKEIGPQGVVVIGVAPGTDAWEVLTTAAAEGKLPSRLGQDAPAEGEQPAGVTGGTAAAYGVRYMPTTVVIDRRGVVRAAGIRVDKVKDLTGKLLAESSAKGAEK